MGNYSSTLNEIVKGAGITFATGMLGYLFMFLFKLIVARNLNPADYGSFELFNTFFGILVAIAALGISGGVPRYVPYYSSKKKSSLLKGFVTFSFIVPLAFSILISLLFFISSEFIASFFNLSLQFGYFLKLLCLLLPIRTLSEIIQVHFNANKKIVYSSFSFNVLNRAFLVLGAYFLLFNAFNLANVIYVFLISFIVMFIFDVVSFFLLKNSFYDLKVDAKYKVKEWLHFSVPLLLTGFFGYVFNWTDNFVIAKVLTQTDLGIYGVAYSLAAYLFFVPGIFSTIFLPILTELFSKKDRNFDKVIAQVQSWVLIASFFLGTIMLLFSEQIIFSLFGPEYVSGASSFRILTLFFLIANYMSFGGFVLIIKSKTKKIMYNYAVFTLFNLILNLVLVALFKSIFVIALISGLSVLLLRLSEMFLAGKRKLIFINKMFLLKIFLVAVLSSTIVKLLFLLSGFVLFSEFVKLGLALVMYSLCFAIFVYAFRVLSKKDLEIIELVLNRFKLFFLIHLLRKIYK